MKSCSTGWQNIEPDLVKHIQIYAAYLLCLYIKVCFVISAYHVEGSCD
jgi:hypothetical protein